MVERQLFKIILIGNLLLTGTLITGFFCSGYVCPKAKLIRRYFLLLFWFTPFYFGVITIKAGEEEK